MLLAAMERRRILKLLRDQAFPTVCLEGARLAAAGKVTFLVRSQARVCANVRTDPRRTVDLTIAGTDLTDWCTCYSVQQGVRPCEHVLAVANALADELKKPQGNKALDPWMAVLEASPGTRPEFGKPPAAPPPSPAPPPPEPDWKVLTVRACGEARTTRALRELDEAPSGKAVGPPDLVYVIEICGNWGGRVGLGVCVRDEAASGGPDWRHFPVSEESVANCRPRDRWILGRLRGVDPVDYRKSPDWSFQIKGRTFWDLVPRLARQNRLYVQRAREGPRTPLRWGGGRPWDFEVVVRRDPRRKGWVVSGRLARGNEVCDLAEADFLLEAGLVGFDGELRRVRWHGGLRWANLLKEVRAFFIPEESFPEWRDLVVGLPQLPRIRFPRQSGFAKSKGTPQPVLRVRSAREGRQGRLVADLFVEYEGTEIPACSRGQAIPSPDRKRRIRRDIPSEVAAVRRMESLGFRRDRSEWLVDNRFSIAVSKLQPAVLQLVAAGWRVEAEGQLMRPMSGHSTHVKTGIDWFEVNGHVEFDGQFVPLPRLLDAVRRKEKTVRLDDGTVGILPEEWLRRYCGLLATGELHDGALRFRPSQAVILDALLHSAPQVDFDQEFSAIRSRLEEFRQVGPADPGSRFAGTLRGYQREGLGWLQYLDQTGFGGCLADDMGLGKTVQVLALLDSRLDQPPSEADCVRRPSLVVAPKSLVFNWRQEARHFVPNLRIMEYSGSNRRALLAEIGDVDLVLTTYGILTRDAASLRDIVFDYVILDEAQAIKNSATAVAKACRLLQSRRRLALSGTPVENHAGELWSLMEFLNPGVLGRSSHFEQLRDRLQDPEDDTLAAFNRGLRPFILRRTKEQVAPELPEKSEQVVYCELEGRQRQLYDELRNHYRRQLLKASTIDSNDGKMKVLEALLRLRQAAIHPGLINPAHLGVAGAKLDYLLPQLEEIREAGHKALIFSQFTSMLAILQDRLTELGISYFYLDGQTRNRKLVVEGFQKGERPFFLVSLKAGGLGLNLTAAGYVFLLDPWWNPAVEKQAVDRAHRIGQDKPVFAYRLIARNTVEERVLELQQSKRELAEALLGSDVSLLRGLKKEDLEFLLT